MRIFWEPVILGLDYFDNLVMDEFEESSSLAEQQDAASSALGVDSLNIKRMPSRNWHEKDSVKILQKNRQTGCLLFSNLETGRTLGRPE